MNAEFALKAFGTKALLALAAVVAMQLSVSGLRAQPPTAPPGMSRDYSPLPPRQPAASSGGVSWEGIATSPLTADWSSEPRVAAARQYYLAQNPQPSRDYETPQDPTVRATGPPSIFAPPPVPRESGGRYTRDSLTTQPPAYEDATLPYPSPPVPRTTTPGPASQWPPENSGYRNDPRPSYRPDPGFTPDRDYGPDRRYRPHQDLTNRPDSPGPTRVPAREVTPLPPVGTYPPPNPGAYERDPRGPSPRDGTGGQPFVESPPRHQPPLHQPPGATDDRAGYPPAESSAIDRNSQFGGGSNWQGEPDTHTRKPLPPEPPRQREPPSPPVRRPVPPVGPTPPAGQFPTPGQPADSDNGLFQPAKLIVMIGDQPILAGDLLPQIEQVVRKYGDKIPPDQVEQQKKLMLKTLAEQAIQTKLAYLDFLRTVPAERLDTVMGTLNDQFNESELQKAIQKAGVNSPAELDAKLREFGSSLEKQRRNFAEQVLAREMIRQNVKNDEEVTHEEMLTYYRGHEKDYFVPTRARWEQLETRFKKFPSKSDAYRAVAEMGNEVLHGAPLAEVARRSSQGFNAEKGGAYDWTQKGSLTSQEVDAAIFSLPVAQMSQIIESENAFHIVRVIERIDDSMVPFVEAQVEIKGKIKKERFRSQMTAYLDRLREQTLVWSIFDEQSPNSVAGPADSRHPLPPR